MHAGGAERVVAHLAERMACKKYKVIILITFSKRGLCHYNINKNVQIVFLGQKKIIQFKIISFLKRFFLARKIFKTNRDATIVSFLSTVNIFTILASFGFGMKVIVSERTYPPLAPIGKIYAFLRKFTYPKANLVVMQTQSGANWLKKTIPKAKIKVIPNPAVFPLPKNKPEIAINKHIKKNQKLLLAVGRLSDEKQFDLLINAFSKISNEMANWKLVILGQGFQRNYLTSLIKNLNLVKKVFLPGRAGNMSDWYRRANLFVLSSKFEGFPNALLEAMTYGCPVVSLDCKTGPRELIKHEVNGILIPPTKKSILFGAKLQQIMKNSFLRKKCAKQAKKIRNKFHFSKVFKMWEDVL